MATMDMGTEAPAVARPSKAEWLKLVQAAVDRQLELGLELSDEAGFDPRWSRALWLMRQYVARPAKRVRPLLVFAGYALARGAPRAPQGLWKFAAGIELLHTFLLIHDDVADQADVRRGDAALHLKLAPGRAGEDLAIVAGDHLFARSIELMLDSGLPGAPEVVRSYLGVCRHTAVGQYLDLELSRASLSNVTLFQTLKVAHLKTAKYGFSAPLACGARLGGGGDRLVAALERVGRHAGMAFQLADDLIGLFGDERLSGKPSDSDFVQGKRTFPLMAAHTRAGPEGKEELEALWAHPEKGPGQLQRARELVERYGGRAATLRAVERATRSARRTLAALPEAGGVRDVLDVLLTRLARREA